MNLYRILLRNKRNEQLTYREKLVSTYQGRESLTKQEIVSILSAEGITIKDDFGVHDPKLVTRKAFKAERLDEKIRMLRQLRGVGFIAASAILSYQDPYRFAKIDHSVWKQLVRNFGFNAPEKESTEEFTVHDYELYLPVIKQLADEYGMRPIDAEFVIVLIAKGLAE